MYLRLNVYGKSNMKIYSKNIVLTRLLLLLLLIFPCQTVFAEDNSQSSISGIESSGKIDIAPVTINGEILFEVAGISAYPAKKRAAEISDGIEDLAADDTVDIQDIKLKRMTDRIEIVYGDREIFSVFDVDARHQGLDNRLVVAETFLEKIQNGIEAYRASRTPEAIRANIIHAALRTLVLAITLVGFIWLTRRMDRMLEKMF